MRSKEIAALAGVSIRTLRHYHQIGLLPEPPRQDNGYRIYGLPQLIRLLRIGQLTELGVPLSQIPAFLDGRAEMSGDSLDALLEGLTRQIELLERQRRTVTALRDGKGPPDMAPEFAASLMALEAGREPKAVRAGREQSVLLSNLLDKKQRAELARLYDQLANVEHGTTVSELGHRFDALGPSSGNAEISALADDYIAHLGSWMRDFDNALSRSGKHQAAGLLWLHALENTNNQQKRLLTAIRSRLASSR
ncbi:MULTISPECIES: MerR family transcriptional regulator [unclassified Rhizobium]|uniref:MerR family transcriptional regulator n=1 Tax=unclassified Rhizobium TaxID=2613769 RepID=UPI001C82E8D3|nr:MULTISPECIES: MerR family transcriptional regulator [unclassified Rhizobium]MBX5166843.1 MerR family transcriptional regulator [Rhizobium sp. NZLR4b]MBX5186381.1 MerR family transcriptional regulator [Rhizobium sp. NZLR5]